MWPSDADSLIARQRELANAAPKPQLFDPTTAIIGGCWVCFPRGPASSVRTDHDPAWSAAVIMSGGGVLERQVISGTARVSYKIRVDGAAARPTDGGGRACHPRPTVLTCCCSMPLPMIIREESAWRCTWAPSWTFPTIGVTHRPLVASGEWPSDQRGATSPSDRRLGGRLLSRTQPGVRPLAVHPGWRIDVATAVDVVTLLTRRLAVLEPLRRARQLARRARAQAAKANGASRPVEGHLSQGES